LEQLQAWAPDLIVVVAFGQILKPAVLDLPRHGCINVHASLLPRWRGAAPINAAIAHGDAATGVSIMRLDPGVDTGPVLRQRSTPIAPDDTAGALSARLSAMGADLLLETLPPYLAGELAPTPQDEAQATYAPMLSKADGALDFTCPAAVLERRVRAYNPWPGAYLHWPGGLLKVHRARVASEVNGPPGSRCVIAGSPAVQAADGELVLELVQPAGKKAMPGNIFLQGARGWMQT
jgi:methionyl-tRNA formyltransferase